MSIFIAWIGEGAEPGGLIAGASGALGREYGMAVEQLALADRPTGTYDARRHQHSSGAMLRWLVSRAPDDAKLLGVTDVELFIPVLTFVFGEAQLGGHVAVVSIARLVDPTVPQLVTGRLAKEAVHEIGHTFGLKHCGSAACVMARSPGLAAVDEKSDRLCGDCRIRYRALV